MKTAIELNSNFVKATILSDADEIVSYCKINRHSDCMSVSSWNTSQAHRHKGYGRLAFAHAVETYVDNYGVPSCVEYLWNGQNAYVLDWMCKNFGATCKCPVAVLKYSCEDIKEAHKYVLSVSKVIAYATDTFK